VTGADDDRCGWACRSVSPFSYDTPPSLRAEDMARASSVHPVAEHWGVAMAGNVTRAICLTAMAMAAAACASDPDTPATSAAAASNRVLAGAVASASSTDHARVVARLAPMRPPSAAPDLTSALLQREDQLVELDLRTQQGGQLFELAYLTAQLTAHAKIIATLDRSLMPSVADASRARRSAVVEVRALYVRRLVEALELQRCSPQ
jgi:hypothetical protein